MASGRIVPADCVGDLLHAHERGTKALEGFARNRLDPTGETDFHHHLRKQQLKTFASLHKQQRVPAQNQQVIVKSTRELFGRLLVIGQNRDISLKELMKYTLGPLPLAIATPEGLPVKTVKATLLKLLETGVEHIHNKQVSPDSVWIYDGRAIIHSVKMDTIITYEQLALKIFSIITWGSSSNGRIDRVIDTYPTISIKNVERDRRNKAEQVQSTIQSHTQKVDKQFRRALINANFKTRALTLPA